MNTNRTLPGNTDVPARHTADEAYRELVRRLREAGV